MREDYDDEFWANASVRRPSDPLGVVDGLRILLDRNPNEPEVQRYIESNPWILTEQFPHAHAVLPRFSFGGQYEADFVVPERSSGGTIWMLIEIESPKAKLVTRAGQFTQTVRNAITQINDWRRWLRNNQDTARRPRRLGGLSLHDMSDMQMGYIVVGRRMFVSDRFNDLRTDLLNSEAIRIVTYDHLIDWAQKRAEFWSGYDPLKIIPPSSGNPDTD